MQRRCSLYIHGRVGLPLRISMLKRGTCARYGLDNEPVRELSQLISDTMLMISFVIALKPGVKTTLEPAFRLFPLLLFLIQKRKVRSVNHDHYDPKPVLRNANGVGVFITWPPSLWPYVLFAYRFLCFPRYFRIV